MFAILKIKINKNYLLENFKLLIEFFVNFLKIFKKRKCKHFLSF